MTMVKSLSDRAEDTTGGQTLAPGQYADIDLDDPHNKVLLDEERLVIVPPEVQIPEEPKVLPPAEATTQPGATGDPEDQPPVAAVPDPDAGKVAGKSTPSEGEK